MEKSVFASPRCQLLEDFWGTSLAAAEPTGTCEKLTSPVEVRGVLQMLSKTWHCCWRCFHQPDRAQLHNNLPFTDSSEMQSCEKVGKADTAGQISPAEKMQGPIPSRDSMIHIRSSLPRPGPVSCLWNCAGWQFPGCRGTCWGNQEGQHSLQSPGWGKGSCCTDTAMPEIAPVAQVLWRSRAASRADGEDQTAEGSTLPNRGKRMVCFANSSLIAFFPPPTHPPPQI